MHPFEGIGRQFFFYGLHGHSANNGVFLRFDMDFNVVLQAFNIENIIQHDFHQGIVRMNEQVFHHFWGRLNCGLEVRGIMVVGLVAGLSKTLKRNGFQ